MPFADLTFEFNSFDNYTADKNNFFGQKEMMTTPEMNTNFDRKNEKAGAEEDKDPHSAATNISVNFLILKQKQCLSNKLIKVR